MKNIKQLPFDPEEIIAHGKSKGIILWPKLKDTIQEAKKLFKKDVQYQHWYIGKYFFVAYGQKKRHSKLSKEERSEKMRGYAKLLHKKKTPEERSRHALKMVEARRKKKLLAKSE